MRSGRYGQTTLETHAAGLAVPSDHLVKPVQRVQKGQAWLADCVVKGAADWITWRIFRHEILVVHDVLLFGRDDPERDHPSALVLDGGLRKSAKLTEFVRALSQLLDQRRLEFRSLRYELEGCQ